MIVTQRAPKAGECNADLHPVPCIRPRHRTLMKKQKKAIKAKKGEKGLTVQAKQGESEDQALARFMLSPALQSACTLQEYINSPVDLDLQALIDSIEKQSDLVAEGNLERIEQMLLSQAQDNDRR